MRAPWLLFLWLAFGLWHSLASDPATPHLPEDNVGFIRVAYHQLGQRVLAAMRKQLGDRAWLNAQADSVQTFLEDLPQVCYTLSIYVDSYHPLV